jgi:chromosome segregation ATPase
MFDWFFSKPKAKYPAYEHAVDKKLHDEKVAECEELRKQMKTLAEKQSRNIGSLEASVIEAAGVITQRDEQIAELQKELDLWKAKAQHRKSAPRKVTPVEDAMPGTYMVAL